MSLILNIETATKVCSVAISRNGSLIGLVEQNGDYSHSENLTMFIEQACNKAKIKLKELDAIAISMGPGSYTGLRIGVSTAKGLCYSLNKPLIAINTLQHIALSVSNNHQVKSSNISNQPLLCPMLDARRMEVYSSVFDLSNNIIEKTSALIIKGDSFQQLLENNQILFFGDGAEKCKETLSPNKNAKFIDNIYPSAKNMISLSELSFQKQQFEDVAYFEPFYLKDFVTTKPSTKK